MVTGHRTRLLASDEARSLRRMLAESVARPATEPHYCKLCLLRRAMILTDVYSFSSRQQSRSEFAQDNQWNPCLTTTRSPYYGNVVARALYVQ